jgi:hypothetical protein
VPGLDGCDSLSPRQQHLSGLQPQPQPQSSLLQQYLPLPLRQDAVDANTGKLLVMVHDWCYAVECYHPQSHLRAGPSSTSTNTILEHRPNSHHIPSGQESELQPQSQYQSEHQPEPERISPAELERRLRCVARDAALRLASGEKAVPVGVLTSDQRDRWAQVRIFSFYLWSSIPFLFYYIFLACFLTYSPF